MRSKLALALAILLLAACRKPAPPAPQGIEDPAVGIEIAKLPSACSPAAGGTRPLELVCTSEAGTTARFWVEAKDPAEGINLVQAMKDERAVYEALPEGKYNGNRELVSPIGSAYTARGSFTGEDGSRIEETRVLAVHPWGDRLLVLHLRYPESDDSQERVNQLLLLLGEVGATAPPAPISAPQG